MMTLKSRVLVYVTAFFSALLYLIGAPSQAFAAPINSCGSGQAPISQPFTETSETTPDSSNSVNEVNLACNERFQQVAGPDAYYTLEVGAANDFQVIVTPLLKDIGDGQQGSWDPSIYLVRSNGEGCGGDSCQAGWGSDTGGVGQQETLHFVNIPAGTYYLGIDSFYNTGDGRSWGPYSIQILGQIGGIPTTTTVVVNPSSSTQVGQSATYTATVTTIPGQGPATGTMSFSIDGSTPVVRGVNNGVSQWTDPPALPAGDHHVTAEFTGNAGFTNSAAGVLHTVGRAVSVCSITSNTPTAFGANATFTATITSQFSSPPTGTATIAVGGQEQVVTLTAGVGTFSTTALAVGNHPVSVFYGGTETTHLGCEVSGLPHAVGLGASTTTVVSSAAGAVAHGTSVTFTATVGPAGAAQAGGTVTFRSNPGNILLGSGSISEGGNTVAIDTAVLPVGTNTITAQFGGNGQFGSSEGTVQQQVSALTTTLTLTANPTSPTAAGAGVQFTASLAPAPSSSSFIFTLDGADQPQTSVEGGVATFTPPTLLPGPHTVAVRFLGNDTHAASNATLTHEVNRVVSTVTVTATPPSSPYLQPIILRAAVTPASSPYGTAPTGNIQFFDGTTSLGNGTLNASGEASIPTAMLPATHSITAQYIGSTIYGPATSAPVEVVVSKAQTTLTVVSSSNPVIVGQQVTFTGHVAVVAPGGGVPNGTITINDGVTSLGSGTVDTVTGNFSVTTSTLAAGTHNINATYGGAVGYEPSNFTGLSQQVNTTGLRMELASSANPATRGASVTFTATVEAVGIPESPTGDVSFSVDGTPIGTGTLNAAHQATISSSTLTGGSHTITATFTGSQTVTSQLIQTILPAAVTVALTSSVNPSDLNEAVTFTATVTSAVAGAITGDVVFSDGFTALSISQLSPGGIATFTTSSLTAGSHTILAAYRGNAEFSAGVSAGLLQVVSSPTPETDAGVPDGGGNNNGDNDSGTGGGGNIRPDAGSPPPNAAVDAGNLNVNFNPNTGDTCDCSTVGMNNGNAFAGVFVGLGLLIAATRRRRNRNRK